MYLNNDEGKIQRSLLAPPVLSGSSTGQNACNTLYSKYINMKNCIVFSTDNAPIMIGNENSVADVLKKKNEELIAMVCNCHLIHLAADKATKTLISFC